MKGPMKISSLIIMAKEPVVGLTKTRLCPPLELDQAANLYEVLLKDTINLVKEIEEIDLAIAVTPPESTDYFNHLAPPDTYLIPVACANIGGCLNQVLDQLLKKGYTQVFALNSDSPSLPPEYIQEAVLRLKTHDLVLGPADDGGYYLIGIKKSLPSLFTNIEWSTDQVLAQTLTQADKLGLSVKLLPSWYDVDTIDEIHRLREELKTLPSHTLIHSRQFFDQWTG